MVPVLLVDRAVQRALQVEVERMGKALGDLETSSGKYDVVVS